MYVDDPFEMIAAIFNRAMITPLDCPLCQSDQIQVCMDANNPSKDFAKCRHCHCQAPLKVWQERK